MSSADPIRRLPEPLQNALRERGFTTLTAVQQAVLDPDLVGKDLRISSQTGSGKTLAIAMVIAPLLENAKDSDKKGRSPVALVIAPTRELAAQVQEELKWALAEFGARVVSVTGGTQFRSERDQFRLHPEVVVGTPGRLLDHLERSSFSAAGVKTVVLDEADQMLDLGFRDTLEAILSRLDANRQTILVSATFPRQVLTLANRYQRDHVDVEGTRLGAANASISHVVHLVSPVHRLGAVINLLLTHPEEKTLIFVRTRSDTKGLTEELVGAGFAAAALSGEMEQRERTRTLNAFRGELLKILVATDVAARGIDVQSITRVIHADPPNDAETYTHRSGRTGRAGQVGESILLVPPAARMRAVQLFRRVGVEAEWKPLPTGEAIMKITDERLRAKLSAPQEDEPVPDSRHRRLATRLLADVDALTLVIRLLKELRHTGPTEPRSVPVVDAGPPPRRDDPRGAPRRDFGRPPRRGDDSRGAPSREYKVRPPRGPRRDDDRMPPVHDRGAFPRPRIEPTVKAVGASYVPFQVTWGEQQGADARRLLALVCRRGQIRGADVGSIQIGSTESRVEVSAAMADAFGRAAGIPDRRDPSIHIQPVRGGVPTSSRERPAARPFTPPFLERDSDRAKAPPRLHAPAPREPRRIVGSKAADGGRRPGGPGGEDRPLARGKPHAKKKTPYVVQVDTKKRKKPKK